MSFLCHKTKIVLLAISLPKWSFRHQNEHFNNEMVIGSDGQTVLVHFVHLSKWSFWWKAQIEMTISMEDSFITTDPNCHWHMSCTPFNGLRIWNQSPNVEHFVRVIQINHDGTIDMLACHINQSIGSTSGFGKFTMSVLTDKDCHPLNTCEELGTYFQGRLSQSVMAWRLWRMDCQCAI
jgi:hypothetical protein